MDTENYFGILRGIGYQKKFIFGIWDISYLTKQASDKQKFEISFCDTKKNLPRLCNNMRYPSL